MKYSIIVGRSKGKSMKYIITGRNKGKNASNSSDSSVYIELGWEVMVNRLQAVDLLQNGVISENDTIVTSIDRAFLYSKIFKNVISNEFFESLNIAQESVIDLTIPEDMLAFVEKPIWQPKYKYFHRDLDFLLRIDTDITCNYDTSEPFVCVLGRFRSWCPSRNSNVECLNRLINFLHERKVGVFVMGQGAEEALKNDIPKYINLQESCYLMGLPSCKFVYGVMSGPTHMAKFCCRSKLLIIDPESYGMNGNLVYHPLFFSAGTNFTGIPVVFYVSDPDEAELLRYL